MCSTSSKAPRARLQKPERVMDGILPRALQSAFNVLRCWIPSAKAIYLKHQFRGAAVQEHLNELGVIWASSQLAVRFQALGMRTRMATFRARRCLSGSCPANDWFCQDQPFADRRKNDLKWSAAVACFR